MIRSIVCCVLIVLLVPALAVSQAGPDSAASVRPDAYRPDFNLLAATVKVVAALALTLALLIAILWVLKKFFDLRRIPGMSRGSLQVLEIRYLAPKQAVALVRVLDRVLIVGFSDASMVHLGELTADEAASLSSPAGTSERGQAFSSILSRFTGRSSGNA